MEGGRRKLAGGRDTVSCLQELHGLLIWGYQRAGAGWDANQTQERDASLRRGG